MSVKRRFRRSLLRTHLVAEVLEEKRLLSGTNDGAVIEESSPIDAELAQWRQNVESQIVERADALYGEQFGQLADAPIYYLLGLPFTGEVQFAAAADRSETNVQVTGVDEGDIVETDGEYIYTISGKEIVVVKAASADSPATVQSRIQLAETPVAMLLHADRLTVISQESGYHDDQFIARFAPRAQISTVVTVLDVANKPAPMLIQETIVDGQYQASRAIGDQVFVVVNNNDGIPYVPELQTIYADSIVEPAVRPTSSIPRPDDGTPNRYRFEMRDEYLHRVTEFVHGDGTPYNRGLTPPSVYRRGDVASGEQDLERLGWLDGASDATPDGGQLTSVLQIDTSSSEEAPISNIGLTTRQYSATQVYASESALYLVTEEYLYADDSNEGNLFDFAPQPATVESRIHKIGLDTGRLVLEGEGVVPGHVESQFSIDEHDGYLRIATTTGNNWWWDQEAASQNHLFVLQDTGSELVEVGSVREVQVSLFDVSDLSQPKLLHRHSIDSDQWGTSEALQDHLAFNYLPESQLLAVPFGAWGQQGMVLLHVDITDGIQQVGHIGHTPGEPLVVGRSWSRENSSAKTCRVQTTSPNTNFEYSTGTRA